MGTICIHISAGTGFKKGGLSTILKMYLSNQKVRHLFCVLFFKTLSAVSRLYYQESLGMNTFTMLVFLGCTLTGSIAGSVQTVGRTKT